MVRTVHLGCERVELDRQGVKRRVTRDPRDFELYGVPVPGYGGPVLGYGRPVLGDGEPV